MLKQWMRRPLLDPDAIARRRVAVGQIMHQKRTNVELIKELLGKLATVRDVERCLARVQHVRGTVNDWFALVESVNSMLGAKVLVQAVVDDLKACGELGAVTSVLTHILDVCGDELSWTQALLHGVVDWEQSKADGRLSIRQGLHALLDEYRSTHSDLHPFLTKVAATQLERYPTLRAAVVKYLPQIGFLLFVDRRDNPGLLPGQLPASEFRASYSVLAGTYYKTPQMAELDSFFGDIASVIIDLEDNIVRQLETSVLEHRAALVACVKAFAELDCVQSLADAAIDRNFTCPELVGGTALYIKGGRHPMQEVSVDTFVPNDTAVAPGTGGAAGAVAVITGPNFSGKSVYLKQVGLIVYLAHIGSYVPAERAVISLVDRLFTRVETLDSVSLSQSTFTVDLHQMATMLRYCTPRSLLLIDEFGKGTASGDGVALLAATIQHLVTLPGGAPKTLVTTHYQELFRAGVLAASPEVTLFQMEVMLAPTDTAGAEDLVPLFRLTLGRAASSFGVLCAAHAGMPADILARAKLVSECLCSGSDGLVALPPPADGCGV